MIQTLHELSIRRRSVQLVEKASISAHARYIPRFVSVSKVCVGAQAFQASERKAHWVRILPFTCNRWVGKATFTQTFQALKIRILSAPLVEKAIITFAGLYIPLSLRPAHVYVGSTAVLDEFHKNCPSIKISFHENMGVHKSYRLFTSGSIFPEIL